MIPRWLQGGEGSTDRKEQRVRRENPLMVHSALCRWNFRCWWIAYSHWCSRRFTAAATNPDLLCPASLLGELWLPFPMQPNEALKWALSVFESLMYRPCTWYFLSPVSPAWAPIRTWYAWDEHLVVLIDIIMTAVHVFVDEALRMVRSVLYFPASPSR